MNTYHIIFKINAFFNFKIIATRSHTVHCIQHLTTFGKHFKLFVSKGYGITSDKTKQNPCALSFISQKIKTSISANLFLNSILSSTLL